MGAGVIQSDGGGSRRRRRGRKRPMSEINVTPFVDVMLVLLIIFMVAAPLLTVGVEVDMPDTAAQPLPNEQEEPLAVSMTADGRVAIMDTEVAVGELVPRLQAILTERTSDKVFLRADGSLPYARVAEVMGAMNAAGLTNLVFVTDAGGPRLGAGEE
ncbi:MAG: ExbD/TolR family protein [Boseongicola sp.]|nr:ExbD/TolR family protein [Silicimonas sp.]NND21934.1 ExbD/TolR family protein [Silicimonas sp.]NNF92874.1 ExbD/TolR family protein [Boseongicola sp.]NNL73266.1 ExbD/TolR family protein [Silicimonas sp.]